MEIFIFGCDGVSERYFTKGRCPALFCNVNGRAMRQLEMITSRASLFSPS